MRRWLVAAFLFAIAGGAAFILLTRSLVPIARVEGERDADLFTAWRTGAVEADVAAIETYFRREGVGDVLPLADILRSDARWRSCKAGQPFAVPPRRLIRP